MPPTDQPAYVSLETMDRIFGPGWRTPYCLWPRGRGSVEKEHDKGERLVVVAPSKQMRLGEG